MNALAVIGEVDAANRRADEMCAALPGLIPEEWHPGEGLGNTPLLWSHMEAARALYRLQEAEIRRRLGWFGAAAWRISRYLQLRLGSAPRSRPARLRRRRAARLGDRDPLAALGREQVAAVDVDGAGVLGGRVRDGVDHVISQQDGVTGGAAPGLPLREPALGLPEEGIVLAAGVDADGRPHPVVVGPEGHARCPDHLEHGERRRDVQRHELGPLGWQGSRDRGRRGDGPLQHLLHGPPRLGVTVGADALGEELVHVEHVADLRAGRPDGHPWSPLISRRGELRRVQSSAPGQAERGSSKLATEPPTMPR